MTTFSPMAALSDSIRPLRPAGYIREPVAPRAPPGPVRLLDRVRFVFRLRHDNRRTEEASVGWIRRFILFHGKRHPAEMAAPDVTAFLSSLADLSRHLEKVRRQHAHDLARRRETP